MASLINANSIVKCLNINNSIITYRASDGKINLTEICKAGNRDFHTWRRQKPTDEFLQILSESLGKSIDDIMVYENRSPENKATWGHPQVAIDVAQWVCSQFKVQITKWIFELGLTGRVELGNERSQQELETIYKNKIKELEQENENLKFTICEKDEKIENQEIWLDTAEKSSEEYRVALDKVENEQINLRSELNRCKIEMRNPYHEKSYNIGKNRAFQLWVLMNKHMTPVFMKHVKPIEIVQKYPEATADSMWKEWYKLNAPLQRIGVDAEGESQKQKKQSKKRTPKKSQRRVRFQNVESDSSDSDFEPGDNGNDNGNDKDNDMSYHDMNAYYLYKTKTEKRKQKFYSLHFDPPTNKRDKYAAVLYAKDKKTFYSLVSYLNTHQVYKTPDPDVYYLSIADLDSYLRSMYIAPYQTV